MLGPWFPRFLRSLTLGHDTAIYRVSYETRAIPYSPLAAADAVHETSTSTSARQGLSRLSSIFYTIEFLKEEPTYVRTSSHFVVIVCFSLLFLPSFLLSPLIVCLR